MIKKILLLFVLISAISCDKKTTDKSFFEKGEVIINGQIKNYEPSESDDNELAFYYCNQLDFEMQSKAIAEVNNDGSFSAKFTISNPQVILFTYKNAGQIYVEPNKTLSFDFDGGTTSKDELQESFVFNGNLKEENESLKNYFLFLDSDKSTFYDKFRSLKNPEQAFKLIDSTYAIDDEKTKQYLSENELSDNISNWIKLENKLNPISDLLSYAIFSYRPSDREKPFNDHFPKAYIDKMTNIPKIDESSYVNNEIYTFLPNYYNAYLSQVVYSETKDWKKIDSVLYNDESYSFKKNSEFFNILLFDKLNIAFNNNDTLFYSKNNKLIERTFEKTRYEEAIMNKYVAVKELLENPQLPENSELLEFEASSAEDMFKELVDNAEGKLIYIDNWATWCGPCRSEFKEATPKLKAKYKDEIEFIYLCHQSQENNYKPTIAQFQIEGKHYFLNNNQTQEIQKVLKINGYPTYNIISRNGEIIKTGNEFRPSNELTYTVIDSLLNSK